MIEIGDSRLVEGDAYLLVPSSKAVEFLPRLLEEAPGPSVSTFSAGQQPLVGEPGSFPQEDPLPGVGPRKDGVGYQGREVDILGYTRSPVA